MDIMLDLETMGTSNNAAIVAIGAVVFDEASVKDTLYKKIDLCSSAAHGGVIDASTVVWWLGQNKAAQDELIGEGRVNLITALQEFHEWVLDMTNQYDVNGIWGNGANFDNVILRNAYRNNQMQEPWNFRQDRCYRTVNAEFGQATVTPDVGVKHNALDDAIYQANRLILIRNNLK